MKSIKNISEWLIEQKRSSDENAKAYLKAAIIGFLIAIAIICFFCGFGRVAECTEVIVAGKTGLGISLTAVISLLSTQIKSNELEDTRKEFLTSFGNSEKNCQDDINVLVKQLIKEKITPRKEKDGKED